MDRPGERSIDDLFTQRVVEDYGTYTLISLPGVTLTASEEAAFLAKIKRSESEDQLIAPPLDADALTSRLFELKTPPLDLEEQLDELRPWIARPATIWKGHNLKGGTRPLPNARQQNQIENWVEFQNYHLHIYEGYPKKIKDQKRQLDEVLEVSGHAAFEDSHDEARKVEIYKGIVESTERHLEQDETLLRWIEQQRVEMVARHTKSAKADASKGDDGMSREAAQMASARRSLRGHATRLRRTREQKALGPLQPGKVTKASRKSLRTARGAQGYIYILVARRAR
ncbi:hypothetical protein QQS21_010298 [Conoideocrella luteorostrata]|uniref:Uncharacterized protein n=1 Tax=Conoideocrella luteorostrata TaxID=1105319 RepID=A0AAJ0CFA5_9HYPO|nr:hypothetical protein QQS21_010298 [Conoideocrella luteorostrata]